MLLPPAQENSGIEASRHRKRTCIRLEAGVADAVELQSAELQACRLRDTDRQLRVALAPVRAIKWAKTGRFVLAPTARLLLRRLHDPFTTLRTESHARRTPPGHRRTGGSEDARASRDRGRFDPISGQQR